MSIGEELAEARRQADLTVAQVSQRTRIRQTIIRGIEGDDYSVCGGDFYARGHIRSIAKVVGADPELLVHEYDSAHRAPTPIAATSIDELIALGGKAPRAPKTPKAPKERKAPKTPEAPKAARAPGTSREPRMPRQRPLWPVLLGVALAVLLGLMAVRLVTLASGSSQAASGAAHVATHHHAGATPKAATGTASRAASSTAKKAAPSAAKKASTAPSTAPAAPPAAAAQTLAPVSATAFGMGGAGQGDNPQDAQQAIDGNAATAWSTDWYTTAQFGNLYPGTGLLLDMGRPVTVTAARIVLGPTPGAGLQIRVGSTPALAGLPPVAHAANVGGVVSLQLTTPARGRYVLIWFTALPPDPAGTFQASVYDVRVRGRA
jgi:cytoskeletal protein RodZ